MKIGILSFAHHHGEAYIANVRQMPDVELLGVADDDAERGQRIASRIEARFFPSYEALLDAKPDGVIICTENNRHRSLVEMAASRGIHVLCEKPIATTLEDARAIVDDPTLAGGGAIMDHTVHLVDIMRWYLGSEVDTIYAQSNKIFHADEVEVETGALEMMNFKNGVFATIDASWCRPQYWPTWGGLTFELVTQRGAVVVNAFRQNLNVYRHVWQRSNWAYWGSDMNQAMIDEFAAAIRQNRAPRVNGVDGLRAVEATLAAYESVRTGQTVQVKTM